MGLKIDLQGKKFGKLTVIKEKGKDKQGGFLWLCECDCGNIKIARSGCLIHGSTRSCGCLNSEVNCLINRIGEVYGRFTIIEKAPGNRKKWLARCECGKEKVVLIGNLTSGTTRSCGCWLKERRKLGIPSFKKAPGIAARNQVLISYKNGAKDRKFEWALSDEQFDKITSSDCHYCGICPHRVSRTEAKNGEFIYNGIDRVDNSKGYTSDNVVPCCKTCNRAKDTMSAQEFQSWVYRVFSNYNKSINYIQKKEKDERDYQREKRTKAHNIRAGGIT
jgi:hypothetical protein